MERNYEELFSHLQEVAETLDSQVYKLDVKKIIPRQSIRMKCQIPLCRHYGVCKICPPQIPGVEEFKEALKSYEGAFIIVYKERLKTEEEYKKDYASELKLGEIVNALEAAAFSLGYYEAMGLGIGGCKLCPTCAPVGEPCRHPRKARPSPEGLGVDITELAREAGVPVEWPPKKYIHLLGLLLV